MLSPSLEDYLEEIYRFSLQNKVVRATDIAACLNVTLPSVNNAIRRLSQENYLIYKRYKEVELTAKGKNTGHFLVERNRILRDFLDILEVDCDPAQEAEAMEHYLSLPSIRAFESLLDFFKTHPDCLNDYLDHCRTRQEQGLGLKDGYTDPDPS